jgi:hypothetical protein
MVSKDFSKGELVAILETIEASRSCDTEIDLRQLIMQTKELVCADYCICGLGRKGINDLSDVLMLVNGNYSQEWLNIYMKEELYKKDPVIKFLFQFLSTHLWSDMLKSYNDKISIQFLKRANDFGLNYGISSGIFTPETKTIGIFSYANKKKYFNVNHKRIIDIITPHVHGALLKVYATQKRTSCALH